MYECFREAVRKSKTIEQAKEHISECLIIIGTPKKQAEQLERWLQDSVALSELTYECNAAFPGLGDWLVEELTGQYDYVSKDPKADHKPGTIE